MATQTASGHEFIEKNLTWMVVLVILVVSVGGLVEIVPLFFQRSTTQPVTGRADFAKDSRTLTFDSLDRHTATAYTGPL